MLTAKIIYTKDSHGNQIPPVHFVSEAPSFKYQVETYRTEDGDDKGLSFAMQLAQLELQQTFNYINVPEDLSRYEKEFTCIDVLLFQNPIGEDGETELMVFRSCVLYIMNSSGATIDKIQVN